MDGNKKRGKNAGSTKSKDDLDINEFEDVLETFLNSNKQQLAFRPLEKKARKMIHEFANRFGLKSKSMGAGNSRYPCLFKTARTRRFDPELFDKLEDRLLKRFGFGPSKQSGKKGGSRKFTRPADISEGQVVGADAEEIGMQNKGHALLTKMGWTKGMALGAVENKGIIMPVSSVVKKGRSGLQ